MSHPTIGRSPVARSDRTGLQRRAESALADHPYRLELRGRPGSLAWPPVCASCGAPAAERITVRKAFGRPRVRPHRHRRMMLYVVTAVRVPVCADCAGHHRATVQRRSLMRRVLSVFLTPMLIPMAVMTVLFVIALRALRDLPLDAPGGHLVWGWLALWGFGVVSGPVQLWLATSPKRVEPQTDVTRACDFSDDVSHFFERERHIYAIRDRTFAEAFAAANRDRAWTASDDARSSRHMRAVVAALGVAAVAVWLWVVYGP